MTDPHRRLPADALGRVRLGALVLGLIELVDQALIETDIRAYAALALLAALFVASYTAGRTWFWEPVVSVPLATAVILDNPPGTVVGMVLCLLAVQSLYGSATVWAIRSAGGVLALVVTFHLAPGTAHLEVVTSLSFLPPLVLVTVTTRAIYLALRQMEQDAARDALLARTGHRLLAAVDVPAVHAIAAGATAELVALTPGAVVVIVRRDGDQLTVLNAAGGGGELTGHTISADALTDPGTHLSPYAAHVRHWHLERLVHDDRYRLLGGRRPPPSTLIETFRNLNNQVELGELSRASHAELDHRANHDHLTHLPTRARFFDSLAAAVDHGEPGTVALLNIDLDDFKQVNDTYGHAAGDELLVEVAARLSAAGGVAGRLGGDEFVVLLTGTDDTAAVRHADDLCAALSAPIRLAEATVVVGASIGVALTVANVRATELIRRADIAMYSAKARGKNRVEVFDSGRHGSVARHRMLEDQLPHAVERGEIKVYYQPYADLATGAWAGVEALVQWQHPVLGDVDCRELLDLAARTGELLGVTGHFLRRVCAETAAIDLPVGVNINAQQLLDPAYVDTVLSVLRPGADGRTFVVEVMESKQMDDPVAREQLNRLAGAGVRIALDDFGTGYVSLASLRAFPIHQLKIDSAFLADESSALDLVLSVGALLETHTVVQGVTDPARLARLRGSGAAAAQGPLLAPMVDAAGLAELLAVPADPIGAGPASP